MLFYVDSCGGNLLMDVGPTGDGRIAPIFEERLRQFGSWMSVNEEAVYATKPWHYQNDTVTPYVWYDLHRFYHLPVTLWHAASWWLIGQSIFRRLDWSCCQFMQCLYFIVCLCLNKLLELVLIVFIQSKNSSLCTEVCLILRFLRDSHRFYASKSVSKIFHVAACQFRPQYGDWMCLMIVVQIWYLVLLWIL